MDSPERPPTQDLGPIDPLSDPRDPPRDKTSAPVGNPTPYGNLSLSPRPPMPTRSFMNQAGGFPPVYQQPGPYSTQGPYGAQYLGGSFPPDQFQGPGPYSNYGQRYLPPAPLAWGPRPYGSEQQQQQQQTTVVMGGPPIVHQPVVIGQSFCCHMVLACFVFWFFGGLFGLIAFILAAVASNNAREDPRTARQLGYASLGVSVAGIIIAIVVVAIIVPVVIVPMLEQSSNSNCISGSGYGIRISYCNAY